MENNGNFEDSHHTTVTMMSDEEQISKILGQNDKMHLFAEACHRDIINTDWTPQNYDNFDDPQYKNVESFNEYFSSRLRCCDEESRIEDSPYTQRKLEKQSTISESCQDIISQQSDSTRLSKTSLITSGFRRSTSSYRHWCLLSVSIAFGLGIILGIIIPLVYLTKDAIVQDEHLSKEVVINKTAGSGDYISGFTIDDVNDDDKENLNASERVFLPPTGKSEYMRNKIFFPTIHNYKARSKTYLDKPKSTKLNKPKIFSSVSFVEDMVNGIEESKYENTSDDINTKSTLLKYLDMGRTNETGNFFVEFGKKILESNLDANIKPQESSNSSNGDNTLLHNNIYWGAKVEKSLPHGYGPSSNDNWVNYIKTTSAIKMETGCGRMQNRLVTFEDGRQACVRYRQNTDQIQGELFSFYLAQTLQLPNLAPSLVSIVNLTDPLWQNIATDIGSAQWNSNRPVVMTKYIPNLESAHIPAVFKPSERHLNKFDVLNIVKRGSDQNDVTSKKNGDLLLKKLTERFFVGDKVKEELSGNSIDEEKQLLDIIVDELPEKQKSAVIEQVKAKIGNDLLDTFVELAQWSDLIIFDYLTANLDRIVNNLYNFQWNVNIMDAPAHNLARKVDTNLLLFLDNESGLLHGYRLLGKYEVYHTLLLDNLCVFRKSTADIIRKLHHTGKVGHILNTMFKENNNSGVLDVLPPLPEKSVKILNERIARVASQIKRCEEQFGR